MRAAAKAKGELAREKDGMQGENYRLILRGETFASSP
jgi:hypothetical protein